MTEAFRGIAQATSDRYHHFLQPSDLAAVSLKAPFGGHLVTDSEQEQDDDEAQGHAEQPEQNEDHDRSPFRLLAARESGAGSIVGEGHGLAGGHPAADHAAGQSDEERRQGAESAVTRDDGGLRVDGNDGRDPGGRAGQSSVPDTEIARGPKRSEDEQDRNGDEPGNGPVEHGMLCPPSAEDLARRPSTDHVGKECAADTEDERPHLELVPVHDAGFGIGPEGGAPKAEDEAGGQGGQPANPDGGPAHWPLDGLPLLIRDGRSAFSHFATLRDFATLRGR